MDMSKVKHLLDLYRTRKDLEAQAAKLKAEEEGLNAELVEDFVADGLTSLKCDGQTVYMFQQDWAKSTGDPAATVCGLIKAGMNDCLMVGAMRLSGMIREMGLDQFHATYPELKELVGVETRSSIRIRKA